VRKDRQSELYIDEGPSSVLLQVWLDPFSNPGSLRVRLKTDSRAKREIILDRLERNREAIPFGRYVGWQRADPAYPQQYPHMVELRISWRVLLARCTRRSIPAALRRFVIGLMTVADDRA
jgi:hypothetical protein